MSLAEMSVVSGGNVNYVTGELITVICDRREFVSFRLFFYTFLKGSLVLRYCNYCFENSSQTDGK